MKRNQYRISILVWRGICSCLLLLFFVAFMMACTENKLYITDQRGEAIGNYTVYFHPRLESNFVTTKSLSPFPKNCIAQVFAFSARGDQQSIGSPVYRSLAAGTLSPMSTPLVVTGGLYNFYAVSTKNDALPPTFSDNEATALQNGVDYLWCGVEGQTINSNGTTIPLTFTHSATQVVVVVVNKDHIDPMLSLNYALCETPQISSSVAWELQTGEIQSATALSGQYDTMNCSGFTASYIMIPLALTNGSVGFEAEIGQSYGSTKCTVSIPVPAGGFLGGHSYEYEMIFNADSLTTALVRVLPWKEVEVSDDVDGFGEKKDSTHVSK